MLRHLAIVRAFDCDWSRPALDLERDEVKLALLMRNILPRIGLGFDASLSMPAFAFIIKYDDIVLYCMIDRVCLHKNNLHRT